MEEVKLYLSRTDTGNTLKRIGKGRVVDIHSMLNQSEQFTQATELYDRNYGEIVYDCEIPNGRTNIEIADIDAFEGVQPRERIVFEVGKEFNIKEFEDDAEQGVGCYTSRRGAFNARISNAYRLLSREKYTGPIDEYYPNGVQRLSVRMADGVLTAKYVEYYQDTTIKKIIPYNCHGACEGIYYEYYPGGKGELKEKTMYIENARAGFSRSFHPNIPRIVQSTTGIVSRTSKHVRGWSIPRFENGYGSDGRIHYVQGIRPHPIKPH